MPVSLEDLQKLQSEGWAMLDRMEENFATDQKRLAQLAAEQADALDGVFKGTAGREVLGQLIVKTILRPSFPVERFSSSEKAALYGAFREGQNAVVMSIVNGLALARQQAPLEVVIEALATQKSRRQALGERAEV